MNKIKLFKASPFYPNYIESFYKKKPDLKHLSYDEQYKILMQDCFGWANFWKVNLEKRGDFEVWDVVSNAEILQKTWAKENKVIYSEENWILDILSAQIHTFKPDVFFPHDYWHIYPDFVKKMKKEVGTIKVVIGYDGIALNDISRFSECNLMISIKDEIVTYYKSHNLRSIFVRLGFEPEILNRIVVREKIYDATFVGSIYLFERAHFQRFELLKYLARHSDVKFWISSLGDNWKLTSPSQIDLMKKFHFKEVYFRWTLGRKNLGEKFGLEMYQLLSDSKITINSHIDRAGNKAGNMRLYEATGVGACLITDYKDNLHEIFEIDKEVVTYKTPSECVSKIKYLINNPEEACKIARAGQLRTLKDHTTDKMYDQTINEILELLN